MQESKSLLQFGQDDVHIYVRNRLVILSRQNTFQTEIILSRQNTFQTEICLHMYYCALDETDFGLESVLNTPWRALIYIYGKCGEGILSRN